MYVRNAYILLQKMSEKYFMRTFNHLADAFIQSVYILNKKKVLFKM